MWKMQLSLAAVGRFWDEDLPNITNEIEAKEYANKITKELNLSLYEGKLRLVKVYKATK